MEFTPANRGSGEASNTQPAPAITYKPTRISPSMGGSAAPIPGADEPVRIRGAQEPTSSGSPQEEGGEEGEGSPEEIDARADLSKRLGIIARQSRRVREHNQRVREAEAAVKAREEALAAREEKLQRWETEDAERRKSPRKVLRDYGFSPEAALQFELSGGKLTPEQEAALRLDETLAAERTRNQAELQAFRDEQARLEQDRKRQEEESSAAAQAEQEQLATQELKTDIMSIIDEDKDAYRVSSKWSDVADAVYARVEQMSNEELDKTGKRPPVTTKTLERAAKWVEEQARKRLEEINTDLGYRPTGPVPRSAQTLSSSPVQRRVAPRQEERQETEADRRRRVVAELDRIKAQRGGLR